jgi:hypothetical protein
VRTYSALALAASALVYAVGSAPTASAATSDAATAPLPAAGTAITIAEDGDMLLTCDGTLHRFDLHGTGQLTVGDRFAEPGGSRGVKVSTTSENLVGYDPDLGFVTVAEQAPAVGEIVSPPTGKTFPASESFAQDVTVSFEHTPCDASGAPATFHSAAAFPLLNTNLKSFPPKNAVYTLAGPVELKPVDAAAQTGVQIIQFPVTVSHHD